MRNFRELLIWKKGMELVRSTYDIASQLPSNEKFGLISQITRSAVSIPSNIAEACAKASQKEFKYFLETALGSAFELETQIVIIRDLSWVESEKLNTLIDSIIEEQRMISVFIKNLNI